MKRRWEFATTQLELMLPLPRNCTNAKFIVVYEEQAIANTHPAALFSSEIATISMALFQIDAGVARVSAIVSFGDEL